jgi:hypothetical protein
MDFDKLSSLVSRLFFAGAFLLAGSAMIEKLANLFGYTILQGFLGPGRLLEYSAVALIFVIALLLRQIRDTLKADAGS